MNRLSARTDLPMFFLFLLFIVGLLQVSGNLAGTGPRIVDDNQIYKLQAEFSQLGFLGTLEKDLRTRFLSYKRMVPLYSVQKVVEARIFGTNLVAWRLYLAFIGALAAFLLYLFARVMKFGPVESATFAALTMLGPQSVIFWKLLQGEGLGMVLISASLLTMGLGLHCASRRESRVYMALHVLLAIAASLTKESFVLVLPAIVLCRIWLVLLRDNAGIKKAVGACMAGSATLIVAFLAEVMLIKYGLSSPHVSYTGWGGFKVSQFLRALWQLGTSNALPAVLVLAFLVAYRLRSGLKFRAILHARRDGAILFVALLLLILIPQVILYSNYGLRAGADTFHIHPARYLLPAMLGLSLLSLVVFRLTRPLNGNETGDRPEKTRRPRWIASREGILALVLVIFVCVNGSGVLASATAYAEESRTLKKWFDSIRGHTAPSDVIVVVFDKLKDAIRLKYILEEGLGRKNLFYYRPDRISFDRARMSCVMNPSGCGLRTDHLAHLSSMRSVSEIRDFRRVEAFLFVNVRPGVYYPSDVEKAFRASRSRAALLQGYERYENELGYVSYYRKG